MTLTQRLHKDDGTCHEACWQRAVQELEEARKARRPRWLNRAAGKDLTGRVLVG